MHPPPSEPIVVVHGAGEYFWYQVAQRAEWWHVALFGAVLLWFVWWVRQ